MPRRIPGEELNRSASARRRALRRLVLPAVLLLPGFASGAIPIRSARVWPAQEYTRLILEAAAPIEHRMSVVRNPLRLVLDLRDVELTSDLSRVADHVSSTDPYIQTIRVARFTPEAVRVVLDLKTDVNPQLFALKPVAGYGHRVVLDLYPLVPPDPLMALLESAGGNREEALLPEAPGTPAVSPLASAPSRELLGQRRLIIIAIDPGHGGEDPGALGPRGTQEKNVTLAIARKLKALVDAEPGMRAMLTRDDDYFVPLHSRVQKARQVQADLFISIHADAFTTPTARGSSVFALSDRGATSAAARWLAQRENQADLIGGVNLERRDPLLARMLLDLSQTAQISDSLRVGRSVLDGIANVNSLHKTSVEQAGFAVLKAPDIPSILVETAFISNPDEEMKLRSDSHQARFAASIHRGLRQYFDGNPSLARVRAG